MLKKIIDLETGNAWEWDSAPALCFSTCGSKIFHSTSTKRVKCWDLVHAQYVTGYDHECGITSMLALPGNRICLVDFSNRVCIADIAEQGVPLVTHDFQRIVRRCARSGDSLVAIGHGFIALLDATDLQCKLLKETPLCDHRIVSLGKQLLATRWKENGILLFAPDTLGSLFQLAGHDGRITALATAPTSDCLLSSGMDERILCWSLTSNDTPRVVHTDEIALGMAYAPDGKSFAVVGLSGELTYWDAQDLRRLGSTPFPSGGEVSLEFSPDSSMLAVSSNVDGRISVFSSECREENGTGLRHEAWEGRIG
jgi:WD40 repeat protein